MLPWRAGSSRKAARRAKAAGDWAGAAQHYRRAIERDPRNAPTWVQYGNALRECGRAEEAETAYRRSLALAEGDPDAHVQLGHLLKQQRRGDEAIAEYLRAHELDPWLLHVSQELIELGWTSHVKPPGSLPQRPSAAGNRAEAASARPAAAVIFDASDLLLHFMHARLPTGIQRVQLQIIAALVAGSPRNYELLLACFAPCRDFWVGIPEDLFVRLTGLAIGGGATDERPWQEAVLELTSLLVHGDPLDFPDGATLVNLGASWPHLNYFLRLRNAKARYGLRFIPFVHDCVPVLMPDLCVEATIRTYIDWLLGLFFHADGYLVNSKSTGVDLSKLAALLGHRIAPPQVIRLDGRFSTDCRPDGSRGRKFRHPTQRYGRVEPFVLIVSTFEPRKNHLLAFTLWLKLIEKRGLRRTPRLVCVGHRGWKNEAATSLLGSSKTLQRRVRILTAIADVDLTDLYQRCLFTLYPSVYEGWGLPVTESLCYGKVPLISTASSLPEAGGEFAEYFDLNSLEDLISKAERLLDDQNYRTGREALIRDKFRPRSWSAIADQVIEYAVTGSGGGKASAGSGEAGGLRAPPAAVGQYYAFARGRETSIRPGMFTGEMFRIGEGWWVPEEWGCWLKHEHADIVFSLPETDGHPCFLYLGLRGLPMSRTNFQMRSRANEIVCDGTLEPDQYRWAMLKIEPKGSRDGVVHLRIASYQKGNLAKVSGGIDRRVVTLGAVGFYLSLEETSSIPAGFVENHRVE